MLSKGLFTSNTDDWATPPDFFKALDAEFHFDLDPCASKENAKCKRFFTKEDNGLAQKWEGRVFCNPPYGREIGKWVKKCSEEAERTGCTAVMLLPARTDTRWFHDYIYIIRQNKSDLSRADLSSEALSKELLSHLW